jgi:hypothetical protein
VWAWIVKLLLQELIGYQAAWYDQGDTAVTFYTRLLLNPAPKRSDLEIQSFLQPASPMGDYTAHVKGDKTVVAHGAHSQTNQGGQKGTTKTGNAVNASEENSCCCLTSLFLLSFQVCT